VQKDSWDIDYQATLNALQAARQSGAAHFVLLSAICVQKPLLEFQRAKLKFEAALQVRLLVGTNTTFIIPRWKDMPTLRLDGVLQHSISK
jgi:divinyl chlorophyllide a 8-vinyl-reductase